MKIGGAEFLVAIKTIKNIVCYIYIYIDIDIHIHIHTGIQAKDLDKPTDVVKSGLVVILCLGN